MPCMEFSSERFFISLMHSGFTPSLVQLYIDRVCVHARQGREGLNLFIGTPNVPSFIQGV
jgi:hypothetical protein